MFVARPAAMPARSMLEMFSTAIGLTLWPVTSPTRNPPAWRQPAFSLFNCRAALCGRPEKISAIKARKEPEPLYLKVT